jgi:hypothetical protein
MTKEQLGYHQSQVFADGKIDFGFPVIDVETELGEKKQ